MILKRLNKAKSSKTEPRQFSESQVVTIDYETTGFHPRLGARIFAACLTWCDDGWTEVWRDDGEVRFYQDEKEVGRATGDFHRRMSEFWLSPCPAVAHNLKFEYEFTIANYTIRRGKILHDTMIMSQYVDNLCPSHALDDLFDRFHGKEPWDVDKAVSHEAKEVGTYDKISRETMFTYQLADGIRGALLYRMLWPFVEPKKEYHNEIELIKATVEMENRGVMLDYGQARKMLAWMQQELADNRCEAFKILKRHVNLNSEKQVKALLFDELKLPRTKTIDKKDIVTIKHPIVDRILRSRAYTKGVAIVEGYLDAAERDGFVHPTIWTNKAGTGRETSQNPNLQNVAKELKAGVKYTVPARRCFRTRPGYILLLADYAGIEMRLAVQGTGAPRLIKLCQENYDFHDACAKAFYGDKYTNEPDKVLKKAKRSLAKNARFAMLYGAGLEQTANTLRLPVEEVKAGYERDQKEFPEFYNLMDQCTRDARRDGYITTFFGRKLRVPLDRAYSATDYLIQGSAAALFKHAQVAVNDLFREFYGEKYCRILLPVHDELVMEVRRGEDLDALCRHVRRLMIDREEITVKLDVEFAVSTYTWDRKNDYKPELNV